MTNNYSKNLRKIIELARNSAASLGQNYINTEHLFIGILKNHESTAYEILVKLGIYPEHLIKLMEARLKKLGGTPPSGEMPLTTNAERVLKMTYLESRKLNNTHLSSGHLLLAILKQTEEISMDVMIVNDITYDLVRAEMIKRIKYESSYEVKDIVREPSKSRTPVLDQIGQDFTKMAAEDKLDPVIGRDKEILRVSQILARRKKNNPVLLGEPGVGKTAIVEGLAIKIVKREVPHLLLNKRIINIDLGNLIAGTKYRGQFEERIKDMMEELLENKDVIIFIDELHSLVGAGAAQGSLDAANLLKPALARGDIQCVGATTYDEYRKYIEKDGALERRFQKIVVDPPSVEETRIILSNLKKRYEDHHKVTYTDKALDACVYLSDRYITDKYLPDKAFDLMDEAGALVKLQTLDTPKEMVVLYHKKDAISKQKELSIRKQDFESAATLRDEEIAVSREISAISEKLEKATDKTESVVTEDIIADIVELITGIPIQKVLDSDAEKYLNMEKDLSKIIIGQNEAILSITKSIRRTRAGLKDPKRPIGSFLFLGPTGVGKTELAKALAHYLFDETASFIKLDMSEYTEKFTISRLIGAPPGYVGYEEGGILTEKVRKKPYSVVLFDEFEKAHHDIYNLLLQIMDDGVLTDSNGRKVDFKNAIIILTSNIGAKLDNGVNLGFSSADFYTKNDTMKSDKMKIVKQVFNPEFINRLDDIIVFNHLAKEDIKTIIKLNVEALGERLLRPGLSMQMKASALNELLTLSSVPDTGAREVRRIIQNNIEDKIAELVLQEKISFDKTIQITFIKNEFVIKNKA